MTRKWFTSIGIFACLFFLQGARSHHAAQDVPLNLRVNVVLVQLNVAVTDNKGNYVTGLRPSDFSIVEDGIQQKLATFGEGNEPVYRVADAAPGDGKTPGRAADAKVPAAGGQDQTLGSMIAGANVFLLFDTSNYM